MRFGFRGGGFLLACLCVASLICFSYGAADTGKGLTQQELRLVSPDGGTSITIVAQNDGKAGIYIHDGETQHYAALYVDRREGATVGVGDVKSTSKNKGLHMALNSNAEKVQVLPRLRQPPNDSDSLE